MDVFISHSREDAPLVEKLERALRRKNIGAWSDLDLLAGEDWRKSMDDAIHRADAFILILSPTTSESSKNSEEWRNILRNDSESKKPLIPIVRSKELSQYRIPAFLRNRQFLSTENFSELLDRIVYLLYHPAETRNRRLDQKGKQDQIQRLEELKKFALALKDDQDSTEKGSEHR